MAPATICPPLIPVHTKPAPAVDEVAETVTGLPAQVICPDGEFTVSWGADTTVIAFELIVPLPQEFTPFTLILPDVDEEG